MLEKKKPQRRCVGCMNSFDKKELIRIVETEDGVRLDSTGRLPGRGAYVCRNQNCLALAVKKNGFARSFKKAVSQDQLAKLSAELGQLIEN